jgi:predicted nucleic acid-binding protein
MIIVANSSPLIALGRINHLDLVNALFGQIYIPQAVYQETVIETSSLEQRKAILAAVEAITIIVVDPTLNYSFNRKLDPGERDVLKLAIEKNASGIIIDDRKARNEAKSLGLDWALLYTTDILKAADKRDLISYVEAIQQLRDLKIYLPG